MLFKQTFRTSDVIRLTGLTKRQLDYWEGMGFLKPSIAPARGKGSVRLYSFRDVVQLRVTKELRDAGASLQLLREVVDCLRNVEGLEDPLAETRLVVAGGDVLFVSGQEELVSALRAPGQTVLQLILDLPRIVRELEEGVRRLHKSA